MRLLEHDTTNTVELPIIGSYPPIRGWQLHSLAHQVAFTCSACRAPRESVMLAVDDRQRPVCPACYARHR